jgi:ribosome-binding factor A
MVNLRVKARIEARILERAAHCVEFELKDPRSAFITITRVELTEDLSAAKIYYSVYGTAGDKSRAAHMLKDATGFVRKQVSRILKMRRMPSLSWCFDDSIEFSARMHKTILDAMDKDRDIRPGAHADVPLPDAAEQEALDFLKAQDEEDAK